MGSDRYRQQRVKLADGRVVPVRVRVLESGRPPAGGVATRPDVVHVPLDAIQPAGSADGDGDQPAGD